MIIERRADVKELVDYAVDLEENRIVDDFFGGELTVSEVSYQKPHYQKNCTSFQSSLEVSNLEDWNIFVKLSKSFRLPLDEYAPTSVQSCIFTNEHGENTLKFAWNDFQLLENMVTGIVHDICSDAVEHASLNDPKTTDDELLEIAEIAMRKIKRREEDHSDPIRAMLMPGGVVQEVDKTSQKSEDQGGPGRYTLENAVDKYGSEGEKKGEEGKVDELLWEALTDVEVANSTMVAAEDEVRKGLKCPHCGVLGINGTAKLMLHFDRMHSRPYTCTICHVEYTDRYFYNLHSPTCFYFCPVEGCTFKEKRESRLAGHLRWHRSQGQANWC